MNLLLLALLTQPLLAPGQGRPDSIVVPDSTAELTRVVVVSHRVGPEIGPGERMRYHLFPGIPSFRAARFWKLPNESLEVELRLRRDTTFASVRYPVSKAQFSRIGNYIDYYEDLIPQFEALPEGPAQIRALWQGIGPGRPDTLAGRPGPAPELVRNQFMDAGSGAAFGLAAGGWFGAATGIHFVELRPESVQVFPCMDPMYWQHFNVGVYELDQQKYVMAAAIGTAVGATAGYYLGAARDQRESRLSASRLPVGVAAYDLFGDPIFETEVKWRMNSGNRVGFAALSGLSGGAVGVGLGLLASTLVRSILFGHAGTDTIEVRNDGFSIDLPLIAISLASIAKCAYEGFEFGKRKDREDAIARVKHERLALSLPP